MWGLHPIFILVWHIFWITIFRCYCITSPYLKSWLDDLTNGVQIIPVVMWLFMNEVSICFCVLFSCETQLVKGRTIVIIIFLKLSLTSNTLPQVGAFIPNLIWICCFWSLGKVIMITCRVSSSSVPMQYDNQTAIHSINSRVSQKNNNKKSNLPLHLQKSLNWYYLYSICGVIVSTSDW